jgi:dihydrofolate reductase
MMISMIAALSTNGAIGRDNALPWHLPEDLRYFKKITMGKPLLMGRKTFESIGRPLPNRENLVLTRRKAEPVPEVHFFPDLDSALAWAREQGFAECFVAGGEAVYREALESADRILLTRVEAEPEGDVFFPALDETRWRCTAREPHPADERHAHAFTIETWERRD